MIKIPTKRDCERLAEKLHNIERNLKANKASTAYIGIDPGVKTGVALYWRQRIRLLTTIDFWGAAYMLQTVVKLGTDGYRIRVIIEDPNPNSGTYIDEPPGRKRDKISQNVGAVKRDAELLILLCLTSGIDVQYPKPCNTKYREKEFNQFTGWTGKSNEHTRDAGMLVIGR